MRPEGIDWYAGGRMPGVEGEMKAVGVPCGFHRCLDSSSEKSSSF